MFRPVPMVRLQVQVPTRDAPAVTRRIAQQGLLHLVDIGHGAATAAAASREQVGAFRELAREIRTTAAGLGVALGSIRGDIAPDGASDFSQEEQTLRAEFAPIQRDAHACLDRLAAAHQAARSARDELTRADRLRGADLELARVQSLQFAFVCVGMAPAEEFGALARALSPAAFAIVPVDSGVATPLAAIAVPASARPRLDAALRQTTIELLDTSAPVRDAKAIQDDVDRAAAQETDAQSAIVELGARVGERLRAIGRRADIAVILLQAQTLFASTGRFVVISGWIPEAQAPELTAAIARVSNGRAVMTVEAPEAALSGAGAAVGVPPILHRNPLLLRPFQQLVEWYGTPTYREIEPTAFFAVSFILMFGLMFGDIGHGAVLVAAGWALFRYMPRFLDYGILLMEAGVASAIFGVLYGSVFGVEHWLPAVWLHPVRDIVRFTRIATALGTVVVSVGFVLGVVNTWRAGDRAQALVSVRGLFGAFAYWTCMALTARMLLPVDWQVPRGAIASLFAGAVALLVLRPAIVAVLTPHNGGPRRREHATPWWLRGLEAAVEVVDAIVSYFANTVSFVRVAAFAAVHAAIMVAVFAMADTLARYRFGGPLSVLVLVAGNIVTILLEGLTVTVQALRLEYYEFFGKFFKGGGEPFRPLMLQPTGTQGEG